MFFFVSCPLSCKLANRAHVDMPIDCKLSLMRRFQTIVWYSLLYKCHISSFQWSYFWLSVFISVVVFTYFYNQNGCIHWLISGLLINWPLPPWVHRLDQCIFFCWSSIDLEDMLQEIPKNSRNFPNLNFWRFSNWSRVHGSLNVFISVSTHYVGSLLICVYLCVGEGDGHFV